MSTEEKEVENTKLEEVINSTDTESDLLAELCDESKSPAQEFQDKIALSKEWTIGDGLMEGRIVGIPTEEELEELGISDRDHVYLQYWMAILDKNETIIEKFDKPAPWPPVNYKFAAIIEKLGYDSTSIKQAVGERIVLEKSTNTVDETDWVIANPNGKGVHPSDHKNKFGHTTNDSVLSHIPCSISKD